MKKTLLILLAVVCVINVQAVKKVAYVTMNKLTMTTTATSPSNDAIIQMLKADTNLDVTVKVVESSDVITDLADYDVIIVQESFNSGDAILKTTGSLGINSIPKPFIYNKTYALKTGKAITTSPAAAVEGATPKLTVQDGATTNDLFKACTITANEITVLVDPTTDLGELGLTNSIKYLNYTTGNVISGASTLLAQPSGVTNAAVSINDIPAGSTIDTETLISRMIAISMNFGAISANGGKNITDDGLTIWRNAVYILAGLTVPSTKATLPNASAVNAPNDFSALSFDGKSVYNTNSSVVNIFNVAGKLISTSSDKEINMSNFTKGIYIVKTNSNTLKVSILR
ncbi:MAG: T9SS type A sorting domain-containing protein [Paludibacter sp.]|nr:T9SS type A sorting domain-containing protein [Paludibacter sp.]